jgi:predicted nucleic acid-binding protein
MKRLVVDASVVIKWFIDEIHADPARRLQDEKYELLAPDLLWAECGNILWKKVIRKELTPNEARSIRGGLAKQPIDTFSSSLVLEPALEIALETGKTVYDACYLALALLSETELVTADERLFNSLREGRYARNLIWIADFR